MNKKLNILIGKIGKSMKVRNWGIQGSESAPILFYSMISKLNPQCTFYMIGKSDFRKLSSDEYNLLFPNHNVIDTYSQEAEIKAKYGYTNHTKYRIPANYLQDNNIKIDAALIFSGFASDSANLPDTVLKQNGDYAIVLESFKNYAANLIYAINETNVPFYLIAEDPRHVAVRAKELINNEKLIMSQINTTKQVRRISNKVELARIDFQERSYFDLPVEYYHTEKIFMMGETSDWYKKIDINRKLKSGQKFNIICNGHGMGKKNKYPNPILCELGNERYPFIEQYVLNGLKDFDWVNNVRVFGKWTDELHNTNPTFVRKPMKEMENELLDTKYTLINSIYPGFITIKPYEMIMWGIIPFIHPDYDKHKLLGFPEFLYVKNVNDFVEKIKILEADDKKYMALLKECILLIKPQYIDGTFLNNLIVGKVYTDLGYEYENVTKGLDETNKISHFSNGLASTDKVKPIETKHKEVHINCNNQPLF